MGEKSEYTVGQEVTDTFKALRFKRKYKWIIFTVDEETRQFAVEKVETDKNKTVNHLAKELPEAEPRYVVFDHEYETADKRKADKLYFVMWTPSASSTNMQMIYMHARGFIRKECEGVFDLNCQMASELVEDVMKDSSQKVEEEFDEDDDWMDK